MDDSAHLAKSLAAILLGGAWTRRAMLARAERQFGRRPLVAVGAIIDEVLASLPAPPLPSTDRLAERIAASKRFPRLVRRTSSAALAHYVLAPPRFAPAPHFAGIDIPRLATSGDLAAWLDIDAARLDWLADMDGRTARAPNETLRHYSYGFVPKPSGPPRLIEAPKPRLKAIQTRILREILDKVRAHDSAHGFVAGRSCLSGAQRHAGEAIVATLDLAAFFPTVGMGRVHGIFAALGYPAAIASRLAGLCSATTPPDMLAGHGYDWATRKRYAAPHLPQGAPTSPALANLVAWGLDRRLAGLAARYEAAYTRYADDLSFSGDAGFARQLDGFLALVDTIVRDEGFALQPAKTRIMRRDGRQSVTGVVVNDHCNVPRDAFDRLKATLHNCLRHGPASQNRDEIADFSGHLRGRVAWVIQANPTRGAKLARLFDTIDWN